jgi:putative nucleotidyltransferase with HDIG domain
MVEFALNYGVQEARLMMNTEVVVANPAPIRLPNALRQLPPLPRALGKALALIDDPSSRMSELVQVLSLDSGLTGTFLRMVNSAYYGIPRRVTSLAEAVGYLGYDTVKSVLFASSTSKVLSTAVPSYQMQPGVLWKHSIAVAAGGEWVAKRCGLTPVSEVYVAGLLHDVGKLVLDAMLNHETQWFAQPPTSGSTWLEMERLSTGHDHAEVGAIVVRTWNLPDRVVEAVACHHTPSLAERDPWFTAAIHVTNYAALSAGIGLGVDGPYYQLDPKALELLQWTDDDMAGLVDAIQQAVIKAQEILGIHVPPVQPAVGPA